MITSGKDELTAQWDEISLGEGAVRRLRAFSFYALQSTNYSLLWLVQVTQYITNYVLGAWLESQKNKNTGLIKQVKKMIKQYDFVF